MFNVKKTVLSFALCLMAGMSFAAASPLSLDTNAHVVKLSTWVDVRDNVLLPGLAAGIVSGLTGELPSYGNNNTATYASPPPPPPPRIVHVHGHRHIPHHHKPHHRHHR